jgi:hypothetical protein
MRNKRFARLPKIAVLTWVLANKARVTLGLRVRFERYIDYTNVREDPSLVRRTSFLENPEKKLLQPPQSRRYTQVGEFFNR